MNILILGARGMLGQALKREFETGSQVTAWDSADLDITDEAAAREKIFSLRPEAVINAAAYNAVDKIEKSEADFALAKKINGEAVGHLARISRELNAVLVHYSSEYVFAGDSQEGCAEEAAPAPVNKYGESKFLGEKLLQSAAQKFYLIRLSRLFGPAGASEMTKKSFVDTMLDLVFNKGKKELDLVDEEKSCPTYSQDLAKLTRKLLEEKKPFGIYHGANSGACTWYEFAREIFKIKKLEVRCNPAPASKFPRPAARPKYSILLNTKLPAMRRWEEALEEYLKTD